MKKLKLKVKFLLMRFFGIDVILKALEEEKAEFAIERKKLEVQQAVASQLIKKITKFDDEVIQRSKVAVDIHERYGRSWAIIALGTNPESIRFMPFENNDVREIGDFLRHFDRRNRTLDSPRGMERYFKECF